MDKIEDLSAICRNILPEILKEEVIDMQLLINTWADYGAVFKLQCKKGSYILKFYQWGEKEANNPKDLFAVKRKINSFKHECAWYQKEWKCNLNPFGPKYVASKSYEKSLAIIIDDLTSYSFASNAVDISNEEINATLSFLAQFHAKGISKLDETKQRGGYWNLETRPFEYKEMSNSWIKDVAEKVASKLEQAKYQCLLHGDSKPSNYGYHVEKKAVAAIDFQYWGRGVGVEDLVCYLLSVAKEEGDWKKWEKIYFKHLEHALQKENFKDLDSLIEEWKNLLPVAMADYYRFLLGWNPEHWKIKNIPKGLKTKLLELL